MIEFAIKGEYIELIKLLKATGLVSSGAEAKIMVEDAQVFVNGEEESRKRRKCRPGDRVQFMGQEVAVLAEDLDADAPAHKN